MKNILLENTGLLGDAKLRAVLFAVAIFAPTTRGGEWVSVEYEARAATVTGQPFGMTVPLNTTVRGHLSYETATPDLKPADTMRGEFLLAGAWKFRAAFLNRVVQGSDTANSTTNLYGSPNLRFYDGVSSASTGIMSIDGTPDAQIGLEFSISGAAKDLPTDQLPGKFTFNPPPGGASHTFKLKDDSGTMLLQFEWFRHVDFKINSITRSGDVVEIVWNSVAGMGYALEFSTNLVGWSVLRDDLVGQMLTTSVVDDLAQRYSDGAFPPRGFYRIRELDAP